MSAITGKVAGVYKQYSGIDKSKEIANFQSGETWNVSAGTQTDDTVNYRLGTKSIRLTESGSAFTDIENISLDLELFADGLTVSDDNDYIYFLFYAEDHTKLNSVLLEISSEVVFDSGKAYKYTITSIISGWNYVKIKKSQFTNVGMLNWATIGAIFIGFSSTASTYVSFQSLYLLDDSKTYDFALVNNTAYTLEFLTLFYNWTADVTVDVEDTTAFLADGVTFKEFTPTLNSFTMSIEKFWANGDFLDSIQSDLILIAYTNTVNGYRHDGLAKITSDGITCEVGGIVNETLELQGSGELTYNEVQIIDA